MKPIYSKGEIRVLANLRGIRQSIRGDLKSKMTVTVKTEDVERVASLAHLKLTPEETGSMVDDLNAILGYVTQLNQLDTNSVAPLAQISELVGTSGGGSSRDDQLKPSLDRTEVMTQAPESDKAFFKVPKVIER